MAQVHHSNYSGKQQDRGSKGKKLAKPYLNQWLDTLMHAYHSSYTEKHK
jgi:hypothetical protein